ncbi:MAG TPA: dienelactone hydrolase family protein [Beijerinckiaceae bacterium]
MRAEAVAYGDGLKGVAVFKDDGGDRRPMTLLAPNWLGLTKETLARAERLARDGRIVFVADMFGDGRALSGPDEAAPLADAIRADTQLRRRRIAAALDAMRNFGRSSGLASGAANSAVGFCFGGGNVLELARDGADLAVIVALHADLVTHAPAASGAVKARLLVLHGSADPVAPKAHRDAFEDEMTQAGADWRMMTFGGRVHSFAEEDADLPGIAHYEPVAAAESWEMLTHALPRD